MGSSGTSRSLTGLHRPAWLHVELATGKGWGHSPVAPPPVPLHLAPRVSDSDELDSPALEVYLKGKSVKETWCDEPEVGSSHP